MTNLECERIQELLAEHVAGTLDQARRAQLDAHLASCAECRALGDVIAGVHGALPTVPAGLEARVLGAVRQRPVRSARWGTPRQLAAAAALAAALIGAPWVYEQVVARGEPAAQTSPGTTAAELPIVDDPVSGSTLSDLTEAELETLLARLESTT